jgi:ABC-type uncharacterized transport system substrate-binding protein
VRRREFITLLGGAAVAWPLGARAQQAAVPVIGFLSTLSPESNTPRLAAFDRALKEFGFVDGRNVAIEYRFVQGQYDRLPEMADELIRRQVAVIVAAGGEPSAVAVKSATSTTPIVFVMGSDPVKAGLVTSYIGPAATSAASTFSPIRWKQSGLGCCASWCHERRRSAFCGIRALHRPRVSCETCRRRRASSK